MRLLSIALSCLFAASLSAQTSILDVRTNYSIGQLVSVSGVITSGDEFGIVRYLQDTTAGNFCISWYRMVKLDF